MSESSYISTFHEIDTCSAASGQIAAISPSSATGPSASFTVTGVAGGTCAVTISDNNGQSASVAVNVTTVGLGVDLRGRP